MPEIALALPFDANEIKDILCAEFRKRLDGLVPLQTAKEYAAFHASFQATITLWRPGETGKGKETLAWGSAEKGSVASTDETEIASLSSNFQSAEPNDERQARGMSMTVEANDGHGGKIRRRVRVDQ